MTIVTKANLNDGPAPGEVAVALDRTTSHNAGPVAGGNFSDTMRSFGMDRQSRGETRGLRIFGSLAGRGGAIDMKNITTHVPWFSRAAMMKKTGFVALIPVLAAVPVCAAPPIRLHPDNPRWFEWRGKATALVTSAEHYGAVLNLDFDFPRYLEALERDGMNYTRVFAGSYVEPQGAFGIQRNTLASAAGRLIAPWARSDEPGYAGGGNKFDLDRFSPDYLARLKDLIREAGRRGVVVELTLFCATYNEKQWSLHPLNPANNIQSLRVPEWRKMNTLPPGASPEEARAASPAFATQEALTRWLVRELNGFDNLFYEIQNEPWADNRLPGEIINPYLLDRKTWPNAVEIPTPETVAWQRAIARVITDEQSRLPNRHMVAQNVANFRLAVNDGDLVPEASIVNFHYAYPEAVEWNRGLSRAIGCDETGFAGKEDAHYRRQAWRFMLSGGALLNNLDYSFTVGHEDGRDTENQAPGGGSPALRRQLKVLSDFLHRFDLAQLNPDPLLVVRAPGVVTHVLSQPGKAHAIYVQGRSPTTITMNLAEGTWTAEWISVEDGRVLQRDTIVAKAGEASALASPRFADAAAVRILRQ